MTVANDDKKHYGTPVPKHNAMNKYNGTYLLTYSMEQSPS